MILGLGQGPGWSAEDIAASAAGFAAHRFSNILGSICCGSNREMVPMIFSEFAAFADWAYRNTGWQVAAQRGPNYPATIVDGKLQTYQACAWSWDIPPNQANTIDYTPERLAGRSYQDVLNELVSKLPAGAEPSAKAPAVVPLAVTPAQVAAGEGPAVVAAQLAAQPVVQPSITTTAQIHTAAETAALIPSGITDWLKANQTLLLIGAGAVVLLLALPAFRGKS